MALRASWKGYLKLSLVSCAVALYPAQSSSERISFNQLNRETGHRLKQKMVDAETEEEVGREDRARGYEIGKGEYVVVEDEELEAIQIESTRTIEIERFVPRSEVDPVYLDRAYYLVPDGPVAEEAFAVIREAMRQREVAGIGRVVLSRRERLLMLDPRDRGMLATTLRYDYEVRDAATYLDEISDMDVPEEMLDLALHIIDRKTSHFDPRAFEDRYEQALLDLIRAKQAGHGVEPKRVEAPPNVINLWDALKGSIEAESVSPGNAGQRRPAAKSKARTTGEKKPSARKRRA